VERAEELREEEGAEATLPHQVKLAAHDIPRTPGSIKSCMTRLANFPDRYHFPAASFMSLYILM
ncbi:MAG TPA: hypothetical protein PLI90_02225, partial [Rhodocyclaceae bacterium]|nr:hypothetical protein [Rhodocyclaceae bacterium]